MEKIVVVGNDSFIRYRYYSTGQVRSEERFLKQQNREIPLTLKQYYQSGHLEEHFIYRVVTSTPDKTILTQAGNTYYESGNMKSKIIKYNDTPVGAQEYYYPNGRIKKLILYGSKMTEMFAISMTESGRIKKMRGIPVYIWAEKTTLKLSDTLRMIYTVLQTNTLRTKLILQVITPTGKEVRNDTITKFDLHHYDYSYFDQMRLTTPGNWTFHTTVQLLDENELPLVNETGSAIVSVLAGSHE